MGVRRRLLSGVGAAVAVVAVSVGSALPAAAVRNGSDQVQIRADGTFAPGTVMEVPGAFPVQPTVVGNSYQYGETTSCKVFSQQKFLAVVGGRLREQTMTYDQAGAGGCTTPKATMTVRTGTAGWGAMRQLAEARPLWQGEVYVNAGPTYVYALHQNGTLYRYRVTGSSTGALTLRGAGAVPGFGAVRSMALIRSDASRDVFLMNLTGGSLYKVTLARTATPTSTTVQVYDRTWQVFDQLVTTTRTVGGNFPKKFPTLLTAINRDTGRAYSWLSTSSASAVIQLYSYTPLAPGAYDGLVVQGGTSDGRPYLG